MVGEAYAHVQDESLKAYAVFLRRLSNFPITREGRVLTAIEYTLLFAGMSSALGVEKAVKLYVFYGRRSVGCCRC